MAEWGFTVATQEIDCPKLTCLAKKGEWCRTPRGRQTKTPHGERMELMTKAQWDRCTSKGMTGTEFVKMVAGTLAAPSTGDAHGPETYAALQKGQN